MADLLSHPLPPDHRERVGRRDWALILGIAASGVALSYLVAAIHARYAVHTYPPGTNHSAWLPLELFAIAMSPATAGFIFLWSERHLQSRATQRLLCKLGIFGFGLILAAWAAFVLT